MIEIHKVKEDGNHVLYFPKECYPFPIKKYDFVFKKYSYFKMFDLLGFCINSR